LRGAASVVQTMEVCASQVANGKRKAEMAQFYANHKGVAREGHEVQRRRACRAEKVFACTRRAVHMPRATLVYRLSWSEAGCAVAARPARSGKEAGADVYARARSAYGVLRAGGGVTLTRVKAAR